MIDIITNCDRAGLIYMIVLVCFDVLTSKAVRTGWVLGSIPSWLLCFIPRKVLAGKQKVDFFLKVIRDRKVCWASLKWLGFLGVHLVQLGQLLYRREGGSNYESFLMFLPFRNKRGRKGTAVELFSKKSRQWSNQGPIYL